MLAACFVLGSLYLMGSGAIQSAYNLIENSGTPVTRRQTLNFTSGVTCVDDSMNLSTDCSSSGGGGSAGGLVTYNGGAPNSAGTLYIPVGGSTAANATEGAVQIPLAASGTASSLYVSTFAAPGSGNSYTFTLRVAGASTSITCEISGASATSCNDTTHTATVTAGQLVDISVVTVGTAGGAAMGESMLLPAGSGGGSSITFAPPYLYNGTNYFVAATGYKATKPPSSVTFINGVTPGISMAGTNGDYIYGDATSTEYFQEVTCTTSIEAEYTSEALGGSTNVAGLWVWDSTNDKLWVLEYGASGSTSAQLLQGMVSWSYNGTGSPGSPSLIFSITSQGNNPVRHYKMAVSGGTLTSSLSQDGGGSYVTLNTQTGLGTISECGTVVLAPGIIDIYSLLAN